MSWRIGSVSLLMDCIEQDWSGEGLVQLKLNGTQRHVARVTSSRNVLYSTEQTWVVGIRRQKAVMTSFIQELTVIIYKSRS
jgi:hypothetical protein